MRLENKFDWNGDSRIAVGEQAAIAVYTNPMGDIVIWQAGQYGIDEDTCVVVTAENVRALAQAITREPGVEPLRPSPAEKSTKSVTNAQRQRAYRQRRRNADVTPPVAEHNADRNGSAHARDEIGGLTTDKIERLTRAYPARTHPISSEGER